jgi:uncharacterized membrane protein YfcA
MDISVLHVLAVFIVVFLSGILSGMTGGGAGMIIVPFLIAVGLTPQQSIATTKFCGIGFSFGGIAAFKKKSFKHPVLLVYLTVLAIAISLVVPTLFKALSGNVFQIAIGLMMIALVPITLYGKQGVKTRKRNYTQKTYGALLLVITFLLQGVFSSGVGILNNLVLMSFFGMKALDASAIQRVSALVLNGFIVITLALTTNFIIWQYAIAGIVASFLGGYIGSNIAIKRGEKFAKYALAAFMFIAGVMLLVDALR